MATDNFAHAEFISENVKPGNKVKK